ncbi:MAG: GNAT family N-acetyltransferase [Chlamydiales bacterium]
MSIQSLQSFSFETDRLFIRPYNYEEDFENSVKLYGDERITQYFDHGQPRTREEVDELVRDIGVRRFKMNPSTGLFTALDKVTHNFIGHFDFIPTEQPGEVEIGYIIKYEEQNKGYGSEIAIAILKQYGAMVFDKKIEFNGSLIKRIYATAHEKNIPSIRLLEKMQMEKIGEKSRFQSTRFEYAIDVDYTKS